LERAFSVSSVSPSPRASSAAIAVSSSSARAAASSSSSSPSSLSVPPLSLLRPPPPSALCPQSAARSRVSAPVLVPARVAPRSSSSPLSECGSWYCQTTVVVFFSKSSSYLRVDEARPFVVHWLPQRGGAAFAPDGRSKKKAPLSVRRADGTKKRERKENATART